MKNSGILLLSLLLAGCGTSTDTTSGSASPAALPSAGAARVVDERGAAVPKIDVVLHERTTSKKYVLSSDAQGSVVLDMPPGVYDVGLFGADPSTATCFYGPLILPAASGRTFVLHEAGGRPAGTLFGRIFTLPDRPLAGRQVVLSPTQLHSRTDPQNPTPVPSPVMVRTQLDGRFEANLGSDGALGLDVELYNADETLKEFVDVCTLGKPCYVEFTTEESAVVNRLRSNQSDGPEAVLAANRMKVESAAAPRAKLLSKFMVANLLNDRFTLYGGRLEPDLVGQPTLFNPGPFQATATQYKFSDLTDGSVGGGIANNLIAVSDDGLWVANGRIQMYNCQGGVGGQYTFGDVNNVNHTLHFPASKTIVLGAVPVPGGAVPVTTQVPIPPQWYQVSYTGTTSQSTIGVILAELKPMP